MDTSLRVVVVEDHDALREVTVQALRGLGCAAVGASSAEEMADGVGTGVDVFVIDLNLPGEDGVSLARRIRATHPQAGIIMVTTRRQLEDKVIGYESGADIYLTKPTSIEELGAAVRALGRRIGQETRQRRQAFVLDTAAMTLTGPHGPGTAVTLSATETEILAAFARARDCQLETWQLMSLPGKAGGEISKKTLVVQVVRLRKKLVQAGAPEKAIQALRGSGYQLCIPLTVV